MPWSSEGWGAALRRGPALWLVLVIVVASLAQPVAAPDALAAPKGENCVWKAKKTKHFLIHYCDAAGKKNRGTVAKLAEQTWDKMVAPPSPSDGLAAPMDDGDGLIDIYLLAPRSAASGACYPRDNACRELEPTSLGVTVPTLADSASAANSDAGATSSSAYILLPSALSGEDLESTFVHEFFHAQTYRYHAPPSAFFNSYWFDEVSAVWAEWRYARTASEKDRYAGFGDFQERRAVPLRSTEGRHAYESWIWALFAEQESSPAKILDAWRNVLRDETTEQGADEALAEHFDMANTFQDFALRNLNQDFGTPELKTYTEIDDNFPIGKLPYHAKMNLFDEVEFSTDVALPSLGAAYEKVDPKEMSRLTFDFTGVRPAGDAHVGINIVAHDATKNLWKRITVDSSTYQFCRDDPGENFDQLWVVLSNHSLIVNVAGTYTTTARKTCSDDIDRLSGVIELKHVQQYKAPGEGGGEVVVDFDSRLRLDLNGVEVGATGQVAKFVWDVDNREYRPALGEDPDVPGSATEYGVCGYATDTWTATGGLSGEVEVLVYRLASGEIRFRTVDGPTLDIAWLHTVKYRKDGGEASPCDDWAESRSVPRQMNLAFDIDAPQDASLNMHQFFTVPIEGPSVPTPQNPIYLSQWNNFLPWYAYDELARRDALLGLQIGLN
jgi:hypothetical protein